jgi:aromatic ring hydroxylase
MTISPHFARSVDGDTMSAITDIRMRPYTGAEYLESLRDGREVWIQGDRVKDVTSHMAFRSRTKMVARLYDALHDPAHKNVLTTPTDTGSGGYTHRFFKASCDPSEVVKARDAIAQWARITYGWTGRSPDYAASFLATLGANAAAYAPYEGNARRWYKKVNDQVSFVNHAPANHTNAHGTRQAVHVEEETDRGLVLSGTTVVSTIASLTHHIFLSSDSITNHFIANAAGSPIKARPLAFACMVSTGTPGVRFFCRPSSEMKAAVMGTPFDYPLSSRMDQSDCVLMLEKVMVPWEDVFAYGDGDRVADLFAQSGFIPRLMFQGCTRLAVKMDFLAGVLLKAVETTGGKDFRGVEAQVGELLAWRNMFWSLTDAMSQTTIPWTEGYVLPNAEYGLTYRVMASLAYPKIREIIEDALASALIYLPSSALDFKVPELRPYLDRFVRGSNGYTAEQRVKLMKLMWDAIGSEFSGRDELYERNYLGDHESMRCETLIMANSTGASSRYKAFAEECMAEYDLNGWAAPDLRS